MGSPNRAPNPSAGLNRIRFHGSEFTSQPLCGTPLDARLVALEIGGFKPNPAHCDIAASQTPAYAAGMEKTITLLLDGDITPTDTLRKQVAGTYVIAADGGMRHAQKLGLNPDLWVGDFDSADTALLKQFSAVQRITHPADKAKSDGELALEIALERSPETLTICGATGGPRLDHALFNLLALSKMAMRHPGVEIRLLSGHDIIVPIVPNKPLLIDKEMGTIFSVVPFSDLEGLSIAGVKWPLSSVNVAAGSTLTLSNERISQAKIDLSRGHAIAIVQLET